MRLWSREEEPGRWVVCDTQGLAEIQTGLTNALMKLGWIARVLDLGMMDNLINLRNDLGESNSDLPKNPSEKLEIFCEYLTGPDDPIWPWSLDTTGDNSGLFQYLVWAPQADDAARIIENLPMAVIDLIEVCMKIEPYDSAKFPTPQYLPLKQIPSPPNPQDVMGRLLEPFSRDDLSECMENIENFSEPEQLLLQYHVYNKYTGFMREKEDFTHSSEIEEVRTGLLELLESQRNERDD